MSSSRSAKRARRARRGISLPGATVVILLASTALSFAIEEKARDRFAMDELIAARAVSAWARALDGHVLVNRAALPITLLAGNPQTVSFADLIANPNTPTSLVLPNEPAQPLAGWLFTFRVIAHEGLPTGIIILSPPPASSRINAAQLLSALTRLNDGANGDERLDASAARQAAANAGNVFAANNLVLFAHEYAGLHRDRVTRIPRPGMVSTVTTDITFANADMTNLDQLDAAFLDASSLDTPDFNTRDLNVQNDLTASSASLADLDGTSATFASATAPFSIFGNVTADEMTATALRSRSGAISTVSAPLTSASGAMTATTLTVSDTALIPSIPANAGVTNLTALQIFAPAITVTTLQTAECPTC